MDDRSSMAKAMGWVTRVTTVSFMMVIPPLLGYFLDNWLGTVVLFMFLGVVFGVASGVWQLVKLTEDMSASESNDSVVDSSSLADQEAD